MEVWFSYIINQYPLILNLYHNWFIKGNNENGESSGNGIINFVVYLAYKMVGIGFCDFPSAKSVF